MLRFFSDDTATTEIYTLSLHDALPICDTPPPKKAVKEPIPEKYNAKSKLTADRKSTRLNSSHTVTSYAVFCLKKKTSGTRTQTSSTDCRVWYRVDTPSLDGTRRPTGTA